MGEHDVVLNPPFTSTAENEPDDHDDHEEALSLRDLPLSHSITAVDHHHNTTTTTSSVNHSRRSSSDFFFESLDDDHLITSPADDIIFRGHLLPFAPPPPRRSLSLSSAAITRRSDTESRTTTRSMRPSRSLDCRKLRRNSTSKPESFSRNSSNSSNRSNTNSDPKLPRWYWLVLGVPARIPAEMELKDIKNRQFRRSSSPASLFSGDRSSSSSSSSAASWRFLSVLSCKSHTSVDVMNTAASFHCNSLPNL